MAKSKKMSTMTKVAIGAGSLGAVMYGYFKMSCTKDCKSDFFSFYKEKISGATTSSTPKIASTTPQMQTYSTNSSNSSATSKF